MIESVQETMIISGDDDVILEAERFRNQTSVRSGLDLQRYSYFSVGYSLCPRRAGRARLVGTDWKTRLHVRFEGRHRFVMHWFRLAERKQPKYTLHVYLFASVYFIYKTNLYRPK